MVGDDAEGFSTFITELCRLVGDHPRCRDLMADHLDLSSTCNHPVVRKGRGISITSEEDEHWLLDLDTRHIQPESLFYIKLEAEEAVDGVDKTSAITLVMRDDKLDVIGFINQDGDYCYELGYRQLPSVFCSLTHNVNVNGMGNRLLGEQHWDR